MGETVRFFPYDITYRVVDGRAHIYLYGRAIDDGRRICVIDDSFEPYFYAVPKPGEDLQALKEKLLRISIEENGEALRVVRAEDINKVLRGKEMPVLKVTVSLPGAVPKIRDVIRNWEMVEAVHEYDILFARRYLIDKGLTPLTLCEGEGGPCARSARGPGRRTGRTSSPAIIPTGSTCRTSRHGRKSTASGLTSARTTRSRGCGEWTTRNARSSGWCTSTSSGSSSG